MDTVTTDIIVCPVAKETLDLPSWLRRHCGRPMPPSPSMEAADQHEHRGRDVGGELGGLQGLLDGPWRSSV